MTRAVLTVLANAYPAPVGTGTLEELVRCDGASLQRHLRLLEVTGAVRAQESPTQQVVSATITESALGVMRRHPGAFGMTKGRTRAESPQAG